VNTQEFIELMDKVEAKGIDWAEVEQKTKTPKQILDLYKKSGPVPVTIIKALKQIAA
jgi:hypothetical protein